MVIIALNRAVTALAPFTIGRVAHVEQTGDQDQPAQHLPYEHLDGLKDGLFEVLPFPWILGVAISYTLHVLSLKVSVRVQAQRYYIVAFPAVMMMLMLSTGILLT